MNTFISICYKLFPKKPIVPINKVILHKLTDNFAKPITTSSSTIVPNKTFTSMRIY